MLPTPSLAQTAKTSAKAQAAVAARAQGVSGRARKSIIAAKARWGIAQKAIMSGKTSTTVFGIPPYRRSSEAKWIAHPKLELLLDSPLTAFVSTGPACAAIITMEPPLFQGLADATVSFEFKRPDVFAMGPYLVREEIHHLDKPYNEYHNLILKSTTETSDGYTRETYYLRAPGGRSGLKRVAVIGRADGFSAAYFYVRNFNVSVKPTTNFQLKIDHDEYGADPLLKR